MPPYVIPTIETPDGYGPTRKLARRAIGAAVGRHRVLLVTETGTGVDAAREVNVSAFARDGQVPGRFDGSYIYACDGVDGDETRGVLSGTFEAGLGSLLVDAPYTAPLGISTEVEISWPLPGGPWLDIRSLNDFVQEALERIVVELRVSMVGTGSRSYAVGIDYPWLATNQDALLGVYDTRNLTTGSPSEPSLRPATLRRSGAGLTLVTGDTYRTGEAFEMVMGMPADRWVFDGTSWQYAASATPGLRYDHWQTAAPLSWVTAFGAAKALEYLIGEAEADETLDDKVRRRRLDALQRKYEKWVTAAADIKATKFPRPAQNEERELVYAPYTPRWGR